MLIEYENGKIYRIYRDSNGSRKIDICSGFMPYFFVEDNEEIIKDPRILKIESGFQGIFGEKLKKIVVKHPFDVSQIKRNFSRTWEADVLFTRRYAIDEIEKMEPYPLRVQIIDIEVHSEDEFPKPEESKYPVISIAIHDSFLNKYIVFVWRNDLKDEIIKKDDRSTYIFDDEKKMILKFISFLRDTSPDILTGWNVINFDIQYLINRMRRLGIDFNKMSILNKVLFEKNEMFVDCIIKGMGVIDLLTVYRKFYWSNVESRGLTSFSLNTVARRELGEEKIDVGSMSEIWFKDINLLVDYNIQDVELVRKIEAKKKFIPFLDDLRIMCKAHWSEVLKNSILIDLYLLNVCRKKKIALPTKEFHEKERYQGAVVFDPIPGLHKNVVEYDMKGLYPNIMITFNMSPETLVDYEKVIFRQDKKGLFPEVLDDLYSKRAEYKDKLKSYSKESNEWQEFNQKQTAVKVLLNSFYGVLGYSGFRLCNSKISATITRIGRELMAWNKEQFEFKGFSVLFGDTDSLFVEFDHKLNFDELLEKGKEVCNIVNNSYIDFVKNYNLSSYTLELEVEKMYSTIFLTDAKKKYFGRIEWEGKFLNKPHLDVVGFEMKKGDTPDFAAEVLKEIYNLVLDEKISKNIKEYLYEIFKRIENESPDRLGISQRISKNFEEYKVMPIHVRAAKFANDHLKANFKRGDWVKFIFVKDSRSEVIGFSKSEDVKGFKIDAQRTFERLIFMKIDKIFETLGINIGNVIKGQKMLGDFNV